MRKVTIILLMFILAHSTSGQQYPNCGNCQRDDVVILSQPPLSYITMRSDGYFGSQPSNDGCTPIDGQGIINCGVETTLMDCERGPTRNLNFSDLSDYFAWDLRNGRNVSVVFRFDRQVNIHRISMWFWNAPIGGIVVPSLILYSSNDNFTTPSNQISIDTSDSAAPMENRQYRLNVDITNEGWMFQSLRVMMILSEGTHIFLSEVQFCGVSDIATTNIITTTTTTTATTTTLSTAAAATMISTSSIVNVLELYPTTTVTTSPSTSTSTLSPIHVLSPTAISNSSSSSSDVGLIVGVILTVIIITIIIIIVVVVIIVVWKVKRNGSTKPEGVYYSTIDEGTLQTSLPNKPEPIYTEMSDEQNNAKNISNISPTQQHVTMQDNPAYSDPKEQVTSQDNPAYSDVVNDQVKLQDNPAYSDVVNDQVKLQDNPAYGSTSIDIKN